MAYDLCNRVVFITGASSGIGRACAVEYHRAGARVVASARSTDKLKALVAECGPERLHAVTMDATDPAQHEAALREARARFGPIDVLVNNAGWASFTSVLHMPPDHCGRMIALNFAAPVALTQLVLPEMMARGSGQIVNISSVLGWQPMPRMAIYSATKAALCSFSSGLRMELRGTGVDVILVCPGSTASEFWQSAGSVDARATRMASTQYTPQRVARAVVRACRVRRRETTLSAQGKAITAISRVSHRLADWIMYRVGKGSMPKVAPPAHGAEPRESESDRP